MPGCCSMLLAAYLPDTASRAQVKQAEIGCRLRRPAGAGREEDLPAATLNAAAENLQKARADNVKVPESELAQLTELSTRCDLHCTPCSGIPPEGVLMHCAFFEIVIC